MLFCIPQRCDFSSKSHHPTYLPLAVSLYKSVRLNYGGNTSLIQDVVKALCYITGVNYDNTASLYDYVSNRRMSYGAWYEWGFFRIKCFKKGTMHFEFVDESVWMKFNQSVAKKRGWVLPKKGSA